MKAPSSIALSSGRMVLRRDKVEIGNSRFRETPFEQREPRRNVMPHVQITCGDGRTPDQKRKIAERVTQVLVEDGTAKRENIHVTFLGLPETDYAKAGVLVSNRKRKP